MHRIFWFFVVTAPLFADIPIQESINDVYYRGDHQLTGSITLYPTDNDFAGASPEAPIYYRIALASGARLADTRVDLNSQNELLSKPIYLACELVTSQPSVDNNVPKDAISIVRWVADESSIWFKVQRDSSTWISYADESLHPPDDDHYIAWTIGISARSSDSDHDTDKSNMPFNTRNLEYSGLADATSSIICVDLTESNMELTRYLEYDIDAYAAAAETSPGHFSEIGLLTTDFTSDFEIARGKELKPLETTLLLDHSRTKFRPDGDGFVSVHSVFALDLRIQEDGPQYLETDLAPCISNALNSLLPFLVIFPSFVFPPEPNCLGTKPHHADNCLPFENCFPEPT